MRVRTALHVQPGQVQRYGPATYEAAVIVIRPDACPSGLFRPEDPKPVVDLGPAADLVVALTLDLRRTLDAPDPNLALAVATAQLVLHHLAAASSAEASSQITATPRLIREFRAEIERSFARSRSVESYARSLSVSARSLTRACRAATGSTPKQMIDQRVATEAKRLLVHTHATVAAVGQHVGFTDPTNFTKFFARTTGMAPTTFREVTRAERSARASAEMGASEET